MTFTLGVEVAEELSELARITILDDDYPRLGLAYCAIAHIAGEHGLRVLTADASLHLTLLRRGVPTTNFNHLRPFPI